MASEGKDRVSSQENTELQALSSAPAPDCAGNEVGDNALSATGVKACDGVGGKTGAQLSDTTLGVNGLKAYHGVVSKADAAERGARWYRDGVKKLLPVLFSLVLTAFLLEALFAWLGVGEQEFLRPDKTLGTVHLQDKLVTWRLEGYSRDRLSKAGLRDVEHDIAKPSCTYRILLLGDSTTEALQVPLEKTFARRLEKLLNKRLEQIPGRERAHGAAGINHYEVINLGCSGYSTGQELVALEKEGLKYAPDLVVVLYSRGDSLENVVYPQIRDIAEPRPYFYLNAKGELNRDDSILVDRAGQLDSPEWLNFLRTNSRLYGVWSQANFNLNLTDKLYNRLSKTWKQLIAKVGGGYHSPGSSAPIATYSLQDNYLVTEKIIQKLNTICGASGARLMIMTFPDVKSIDPEFKRQLTLLREQSKQEKFSLLELSPNFARVANPNDLFLEVHFSEAGHEVVAQALAEKLLSAHEP